MAYKIIYGEKSFPASSYQEKIFDFVENGTGNLVINACAGSSKTTTIVNCLNLIDNKKILFVAFNKAIVEEIESRIGARDNVNITTFHGLGYSILAENLKLVDQCVDEYKYENYIINNINNLTPMYGSIDKHDQRTYIKNIIKLTDYFRYFMVHKSSQMKKIAKKYGISTDIDEISVVQQVLKWGKEHLETIDYTDMVWLPNVLNLNSNRHKYNWIFVDEGQDTSIMEEELLERCFGRGARFVVVGDNDQQINSWAGSDTEAIDKFRKKPNTQELDLPICYRCPSSIVRIAQQYSGRIKASARAIEGSVRFNVSKYAPVSDDMVLCRNTAPLVSLQMDYIRINKKSYIKGAEEIRENLLSLIAQTDASNINTDLNSGVGLFPDLYRSLFKLLERIKVNNGLTEESAIHHTAVLNMYDNIEALKVVAEGLSTVEELEEKVKTIFSTEQNGVILSTVHKSKGLEANNVYIYYPSMMPSRMAKQEWEIKAEKNLLYVATTRAKESLNYIEESGQFSKIKGYFEPAAMLIYFKTVVAPKIGYVWK